MKVISVRGLEIGAGIPKICVPLTPANERELIREMEALNDSSYDLLEWRADYLETQTDFDAIYGKIRGSAPDKPLLVTFRSLREGGRRALSDQDYILLYRRALRLGADLIDAEWQRGEAVLAELLDAAHACGAYVIVSNHDFDKTPPKEEIIRRLLSMQDMGADLLKIALMPHSAQDVLNLICATEEMNRLHARQPVITMSMGRLGAFSRICGALTGSCITFGCASRSSAPGQICADSLRQMIGLLGDIQEGDL